MWDAKEQRDITHLHLGVLTQYPHDMDGWGRDKVRADVISNTMNPLQAYASLGDNNIKGTSGGDILRGLQGDDLLRGESGADVMYGGTGADILRGGLGRDYMYGGDGPDIYDFDRVSESSSRASGSDLLKFESAGTAGGDKIDLSDIDPNSSCPETLNLPSTGHGRLFPRWDSGRCGSRMATTGCLGR